MSCQRVRIHISALLDGTLDEESGRQVKSHLRECPECGRFYSEQAEIENLLREGLPDLEPPARIWTGIQARIRTNPTREPWWSAWVALFRIPKLRYALAVAILVVLVGSVALLRLTAPTQPDPQVLAAIQHYTLRTEGNPFMAGVTNHNPFFSVDVQNDANPFQGARSTQ